MKLCQLFFFALLSFFMKSVMKLKRVIKYVNEIGGKNKLQRAKREQCRELLRVLICYATCVLNYTTEKAPTALDANRANTIPVQ